MHNTYKEIKAQYDALVKTADYMEGKRAEHKRFFDEKRPKSVVFIGSGSSYHVAQSAELMVKVRLGIDATSIPAGDIMINYRSYSRLFENSLIVAISRSGSTSEIIEAIKNINSIEPVPVIGICCRQKSELCRVSDLVLEIPWAFDESVCQTRSVTNLYAAGALLTACWAEDEKLASDIKKAIKLGNAFMEKYEGGLKQIAQTEWKDAIVLADGEIQGLSAEAALAFKEIAQVPAVYYHLLDVRHGPIVLIGGDTLILARITGNGLQYQKELLEDLAGRGSRIITFADEGCEIPTGVSLNIPVDGGLDNVAAGILFIFISQITAYYKATQKGLNPDTPDGLDAWIKL